MNFLSPWWLALAGAAAVPLFLHLRRQQVETRRDFPAVRWLQRAEREHSRELRLRNFALMLLRVLIVLLVALAAARPVGRGLPGGHAPTALAIVLDNSLSTSHVVKGGAILDRLKQSAERVARAATAEDRVWLVTADGAVTGGTPAQVAAAIARTEALDGAGDMPAAVARAVTLARTAGRLAPRVAVATDGQASAWAAPVSADGVDVAVLVPALGARPADHALTSARGAPARWTPRGALDVEVRGGDSLPVHVLLAGRTLARGTAGDGAPLRLVAAPSARGWLAGAAELPADELRGDDRRFFAVWIGAAPRVGSDPSAGPYARAVLDALVADGRAAAGNDVVLTGADALRGLPALIVAPSAPGRAAAANAALARAGVPWRFAALSSNEATAQGDSRVAGARVLRRWTLEPVRAADGGAVDTIAMAGGAPWIVAGPRYVLVASALDTASTDLAFRAGFAPWVADMLGARLSGDGGPIIDAGPGATVKLPSDADGVVDADGTPVPSGTSSGARSYTASGGGAYTVPSRAGVYFPVRRGNRVGAVVVNPEVEELDVTGWTAGAVGARIGARTVRATDDATRWESTAFGGGAAASLVVPALLSALLLLGAEAVLARHGRAA